MNGTNLWATSREAIDAARSCHSHDGRNDRNSDPFYFPDGKARCNVAEYRPPTEDVDAEYPIILTTGRVVSHFLSGTQTRRIGPLVEMYPEPRVEIHPQLAARINLTDGDWITVESRRASCTLRAQVVRTIRPDTVFAPYHWAGPKSINRLTIAAQDPITFEKGDRNSS
jgi:assimilatory nitrate reductase catalytic subunit